MRTLHSRLYIKQAETEDWRKMGKGQIGRKPETSEYTLIPMRMSAQKRILGGTTREGGPVEVR